MNTKMAYRSKVRREASIPQPYRGVPDARRFLRPPRSAPATCCGSRRCRTPEPMAGEVRVRLRTSGVNPSDVKSRSGSTGRPMPFPRIIPHSDGAGEIDAVGPGVTDRPSDRPARVAMERAVEAPWGTAAQYHAASRASRAAARRGGVGRSGVPRHPGDDGLAGGAAGRAAAGAHPAGHGGGRGGRALRRADRPRPGARVIGTVSGAGQGRPCPEPPGPIMSSTATQRTSRPARVRADAGFRGGCGRGGGRRRQCQAAAWRAAPTRHTVVYGTGQPEVTIPGGWMLFSSITLQFMLVYELATPTGRRRSPGCNR